MSNRRSSGKRSSPPVRHFESGFRVAADCASVLLAFATSYCLYRALVTSGRWNWLQPPEIVPYVRIALVYAAIMLAVFWHLGLYRPRASVLNLWELRTALLGVAIGTAFFFALLFFFKLEGYSRSMVSCSIGLG